MGFTVSLLTAAFSKLGVALVFLGLSVMFAVWYRRNMSDKVDGEPLLAEEALVHDKSDYVRRYGSFYVIHFYIAARDTVVTCDVPYAVWRDLEMKSRGILTHQHIARRQGGVLGRSDACRWRDEDDTDTRVHRFGRTSMGHERSLPL